MAGLGITNQIFPSLSNSTSLITCVGSFTMDLLSVNKRALCNSIILLFSTCISSVVMIAGVIVFHIWVKINVRFLFVLATRFPFSGGHLSENNQHTRR